MGLRLTAWRDIENKGDVIMARELAEEGDTRRLDDWYTGRSYKLPYSSFHQWRIELGNEMGIDFEAGDQVPDAHSDLEPLMEHQDNEGSLSQEQMAAVAQGLRRLQRDDELANFLIGCGEHDPPLLVAFE